MKDNKNSENLNIIKKLPELCPCCFSKSDFTDTITKDGEEYETDAWFCKKCGGLVCWK